MRSRPFYLIAVIAILAVAAPSTAGAAELTYPAGTRGLVGQELTMTGKNTTLTTTAWGPIICETLNLNARITKNNGTEVEESGNNAIPTQSGCYNEVQTRPVTVEKVNITRIFSSEANGPAGATKKGTMSFTQATKLPGGIVCNYTGTNVPFTYVSTASPAVITFNKGAGITSTGGCGSAALDGSFTLHGPGVTTPVVLH